MVDRPNKKPLSINPISPGLAPQATVDITHGNSRVSAVLPTGESVSILLHGATIISWKDAGGSEKLFLSEAAKLDGSKAVRGGIPLVFPVFGTAPDHAETAKLPQHGLARTSRWEFLGKSTSEGSAIGSAGDGAVKLDFGLSPSNVDEALKGAWPFAFGLIYSVTLGREGLTTSMLVRNEGDTAWEFQVLLHTYLRVKDISAVSVAGLESSSYVDKVAAKTTTSPSSPALSIVSRTDRVYTPAGGPSTSVVVSEDGKKKYTVIRDNMNQVVVWNPWDDGVKALGDFEPKAAYKEMICIEAGAVNGWQKLEAGETWEGGQVLLAN